MLLCKGPSHAIEANVLPIPQRRTSVRDRLSEHVFHRLKESGVIDRPQGRGGSGRTYLGSETKFVGIDRSHSGKHGLIEKGTFQRRFSPRESCSEFGDGVQIRPRIRADVLKFGECRSRDEQLPKRSRIHKPKLASISKREPHVSVGPKVHRLIFNKHNWPLIRR